VLYFPCMTHRIGAKGQVVIPKEIRDRARLSQGTEVAFEERDGDVIVRAAERPRSLRGRLGGSGMAARLLEDRRREPR
jgi:AbrB family looped-hinge helix DNA binding protein